ncbi:MAG: DUF427 domain-containing protein [Gammaproteobacteria bacterium]|nr:DUF427 domain-containing protein [Gammaproteobacteria bacterium]
MKAYWKNHLLADSDETVIVENNHYFPPESLMMDCFQTSSYTSHCPWKGTANYYTILVNGEFNEDAAWYYPSPKEAAMNIKGRVAFWKGVKIID